MNFSNAAENFSHFKLIDADIEPDCIASVVLPVCNEAECLLTNLESLARQIDFDNRPLDPKLFEIIVFANNCDDDSARIARRWQRENIHLNVHVAEAKIRPENSNIGFVRRLLKTEAFERLRRNRFGNGVILTTDADTRVAPDWIAANLREIKNGAEAVGGRILLDARELCGMNRNARRFHLLDTEFQLLAAETEARLDYVAHDSLPRHHQHFNASFAVTTAAFERAGGVPRVRFLEDVAFYNALFRVDARFRHSPLTRVTTSARHCGRTELGLSTQISEWAILGENGADFLVESAAAVKERVEARRTLRRLWEKARRYNIFRAEISPVADKLLVEKEFVFDRLSEPQTFGCLYENILREQTRTGEWTKRFPPEAIEKSLSDLRKTTRRLRRTKSMAAGGL